MAKTTGSKKSVAQKAHGRRTKMHSREMYGRYRQLVEELSTRVSTDFDWFEELKAVVLRFDLDANDLDRSSARFLCDELCDQFEQEAFQTDNDHRRKVLMAATKLLELHRPPAT
jgi:hypothetical protein